MTGGESRDAVLDALRRPLADRGLDLEDVQVSSAGRRKVVRVLIDKDGGVSLDDIAEATTHVSAALDRDEVLGDAPYTLEVTSPGVDRPLSQPRHWRRNVDRLVTVTPNDGQLFTGRILEAGETAATLAVGADEARWAYTDIAKARVEIEFNRAKADRKPRRRDRSAVDPADSASHRNVKE
ncbi:MAG: ribosome maturation factor RimP [Lapillicoccus sp.]